MNKSFALIVPFIFTLLFSQGKPYAGPEDPAGDPSAEREGYMTGNRVLLYFKNTTELSDWPATNASRWPNNNDGVKTKKLSSIGTFAYPTKIDIFLKLQ